MLPLKVGCNRSEEHTYFLGVCIGYLCPKIELSEVEHKVLNCWLGEWRGVRPGAFEKTVTTAARMFTKEKERKTQGL